MFKNTNGGFNLSIGLLVGLCFLLGFHFSFFKESRSPSCISVFFNIQFSIKQFLPYDHLGGRFGRDKTYEKIASRFYWPLMSQDVRSLVQTCDTCQRTNDGKFSKEAAPLHPIAVRPKVWNMVNESFYIYSVLLYNNYMFTLIQVGIDLIGPLPMTTKGNKYIITLVDYFSKWPEAQALENKSAEGVALFLYKMMCWLAFCTCIVFL